MRASADGVLIYDEDGMREIALPHGPGMPGRSDALDDMIAAIRTGEPPLHDGRWGKANVEVTLAMLHRRASAARSCCSIRWRSHRERHWTTEEASFPRSI